MLIRGWQDETAISGKGYAQYLATKHDKKINYYDIEYNIKVDDYLWNAKQLPEEFIRAVEELWSLLDDADAHKLYDGFNNYEREKNASFDKKNVYTLCELFITKEINKVLKHNDDEYFYNDHCYVAVDDDHINISKAMHNAADIINDIGKGMFRANPEGVTVSEVISPRKNDVTDSTDEYGNAYEIGDLVAYGTNVSIICGIMNCKLLIANGNRVDKSSCILLRKASGQPLKYGVFG